VVLYRNKENSMKIVILVIMLPFLIPIVLAIIFIIKIIVKGKNEAWIGTVIDKNHNTKRDDEFKNKVNHFYSLKMKMKEGRERNIAVSSEFWNSVTVGDLVEKPKGALYPKKV
jgi:hypothetical protein